MSKRGCADDKAGTCSEGGGASGATSTDPRCREINGRRQVLNRGAGKSPLSRRYRGVGKYGIQDLSLQWHRSYGNTKAGAYMCEKDTAATGIRAAKNEKHP